MSPATDQNTDSDAAPLPDPGAPTPKGSWSLWNGTAEVPLTLAGIWNGTNILTATIDQVV
ncbi:hypothetical protein [Spirillospora sp. CA-294931]|uniref:hypothetical protein n=1 Tax=Spirillospora sp. CA-294931 TaxID=3240042 RepID=UPI003D9252EF